MAARDGAITPPTLAAWIAAEPRAVAWVGPDGRYQIANQLMAERLGAVRADDLRGEPRAERLSQTFAAGLADSKPLQAYLHRLADGGHDGLSLVLFGRGAPVRVWRYTSVPLHSEAGDFLGWRESIQENTELSRLQRQLDEQKAAFDHIRREYEQRLQMKSQAISQVTHELRTPMTAVIGLCHMLLSYSGEMTERQSSYVQKILRNSSVLLQLLNNVLDMSAIETGRVNVMRECVDLEGLIQDALETVEPQTWEKELTVELRIDPDLPELTSDRLKLKQILINLLSNAVKYTNAGQVTVTAHATSREATVVVRDTGIGIDLDQFDRIFDPYVQVHEQTSVTSTPSTGLGLAICRRLAELLGGTIAVESEPGVGSAFTLTLPITAPARPPEP